MKLARFLIQVRSLLSVVSRNSAYFQNFYVDCFYACFRRNLLYSMCGWSFLINGRSRCMFGMVWCVWLVYCQRHPSYLPSSSCVCFLFRCKILIFQYPRHVCPRASFHDMRTMYLGKIKSQRQLFVFRLPGGSIQVCINFHSSYSTLSNAFLFFTRFYFLRAYGL